MRGLALPFSPFPQRWVSRACQPAHADEAQAKDLFKAMSDYLAAQSMISFDYDASLEMVTRKQDQKIAFTSSGSVTLNRPDKLRATRTGGFANVEMVFDGKTVSLLGKNANAYAQAEAPGSIDNLVDVLRDKYHMPLPAADLLMSNAYDQLMPLVTDVKDLGTGVIRGDECDHLAFRTKTGRLSDLDRPGRPTLSLPLSDHHDQGERLAGYTIDVRDWKTGGDVASK